MRSGLGVAMVATLLACATPEGPRLPLPTQDLGAEVPKGYARVVLFNDSLEGLYFESGNIRIQLNGMTAPSLYLNHYAQLFLPPGDYEFLIEHYDLFWFRDRYRINIRGPEAFMRLWCTLVSTKYELVDQLPADFTSHYTGGRDPRQWPKFEPLSTPSPPKAPSDR
jgi:hypothetical protein